MSFEDGRLRLHERFGFDATLMRTSTVFDPATGNTTSSSVLKADVSGRFVQAETAEEAETLVRSNQIRIDLVIISVTSNVGGQKQEPIPNDTLTDMDGVKWRLESVVAKDIAGKPFAWLALAQKL